MPAESHGFYSYDAKYMAAKAFRAVGCDGMARADFFVTPDMRILGDGRRSRPMRAVPSAV